MATDVFTPQDRDAAREATGLPHDAFVVGIVAVNKGAPSRKSLAEMIEAFAIFRARHDDARPLPAHRAPRARTQGTHLPSLIDDLGLDERRRASSSTSTATSTSPFAPEDMAATYATFDVLLNASMGEGFGLTVLEAQACGVPAIVTDFTAMREVCGAGWKVGYERYWTDQSSWQARPHIEEIVESLEACYALDARARGALVGAGPRARAPVRRRPRARGALAAGALEVALRLPGLGAAVRVGRRGTMSADPLRAIASSLALWPGLFLVVGEGWRKPSTSRVQAFAIQSWHA